MAKDIKEINKEIMAIGVAGAKLDTRIHVCAVDVATHFAEFKDIGLVNRLYNALSKGARKSAMTEWLLAYLAVVPNEEKATQKDNPFRCAKDANGAWIKVTDVVAAEENPWYNCKPDPKPDAMFDFQKFVKQALAKYGKAEDVKGVTKEQMEALAVMGGLSAADVPSRPIKMAVADLVTEGAEQE